MKKDNEHHEIQKNIECDLKGLLCYSRDGSEAIFGDLFLCLPPTSLPLSEFLKSFDDKTIVQFCKIHPECIAEFRHIFICDLITKLAALFDSLNTGRYS